MPATFAPSEIGKTYGIWLVIAKAENTSHNAARWHCRCPYGHERPILGRDLRRKPPICHECRKAQQEGISLPLLRTQEPPQAQKPDAPPRPPTRHEEAVAKDEHEWLAKIQKLGLSEYLATLVSPNERHLSFLGKLAARPATPYRDHERIHQFIIQVKNRIG